MMRPAAVCPLVMLVLLAGCAADVDPGGTGGTSVTGPQGCTPPPLEPVRDPSATTDSSEETLRVEFSSDGPFIVDLPAPVSADGTSMQDWLRNASVPAGWQVSLGETKQGPGLHVTGEGSGVLQTCSKQAARGGNDCCAEAYLNARWGAGQDTRPNAVSVLVTQGTVGLELTYSATSAYCGANAAYSTTDLGYGWHDLPGSAEAVCT